MLNYLLVGLGGAIVSVLRFGFSGLIAIRFGQTFPWGTLFVNVTGCFMIGLFATLTAMFPNRVACLKKLDVAALQRKAGIK